MTATYDTVADNRRGVPRWLALLAQVPPLTERSARAALSRWPPSRHAVLPGGSDDHADAEAHRPTSTGYPRRIQAGSPPTRTMTFR